MTNRERPGPTRTLELRTDEAGREGLGPSFVQMFFDATAGNDGAENMQLDRSSERP